MTDERDQDEAPLVEALRAYRERHTAAFHTPGHKLGAGAPPDLTEALGERLLSAIPVLGPGEEVTAETAAYAAQAAARGVLIHGPRDVSLATLRVVVRE